jgi:hypothetical protein
LKAAAITLPDGIVTLEFAVTLPINFRADCVKRF